MLLYCLIICLEQVNFLEINLDINRVQNIKFDYLLTKAFYIKAAVFVIVIKFSHIKRNYFRMCETLLTSWRRKPLSIKWRTLNWIKYFITFARWKILCIKWTYFAYRVSKRNLKHFVIGLGNEVRNWKTHCRWINRLFLFPYSLNFGIIVIFH